MKIIIALTLLFGVVNSAKILAFFQFPSISHQFVYHAIVKELSLRGHEVTFVTPNPINDTELKNLTEVDISVAYQIFNEMKMTDFNWLHPIKSFKNMQQFIIRLMSMGMEEEGVKEILKKPENSYDLIVVEVVNPILFAFQYKFKAPLIVISSCALITPLHEMFGNPVNPVLYPDVLLGQLNPLSDISSKIKSLCIYNLVFPVFQFLLLPQFEHMAKTYFGNDIPSTKDIIKNVSLIFGNVNPIFSQRRPLAPNVKEVWNIHLKTPEPLPKDLQTILDGAQNGAVYFSLGTNVRFEHVEGNIKEEILRALGELPYTVLCKWDKEDVPGRPKNVILRKWFPQQSILAHPNVKAFVMQGGLQSSEEAIINGVPLVVIPFLGDQPLNAKILTSRGMGQTILPQSINKELLRDTILQVAKDEKYRLKAQELRSIFLDQPRTGLEEIVWWCEYVIRHKGAKHLRSPGADIPFYEYFMLDVLAVILAALFVTYKVISIVLRTLISWLRKTKHEKLKKN